MAVSRLAQIPQIGVERVGDEADRLAREHPDLLRLENLDTDLRPPEAALAATRAAIERDDANSYLPFFGIDALRQAAAGHVVRRSGQAYDWGRECLVTTGGCNGVLVTLLALLEPGDEVLVTDPIYVGLLNRIRLAGGVPRFVPLVPTPDGWRLDLAALNEAAKRKPKVVLAMSPSMPSGALHDAEEWQAIADLVRATGAWLLYDAAMERIVFDGRPTLHPASLPGLYERTITVGSVSKEFRMIGWRVGWVVGPPAVVADIARVSISDVVCQVGIGMPGAAAALEGPESDVAAATAIWQARRDLILAELDGMPVIPPHGGWSLLLDVAQLGLDSAEASRRLMARGHIAATPMVNWGSAAADRYVRFVFANEPVERLAGLGRRVREALA